MERFAVIATGGKQYTVKEGQVLSVEKLPVESGATTFADVLMIGGDTVSLGTPMVKGASVKATVLEHGKADKIVVRKYKAKVRYRRKRGHRQQFTKVRIDAISAT